MYSAIGETWIVVDFDSRKAYVSFVCNWEKLEKGNKKKLSKYYRHPTIRI